MKTTTLIAAAVMCISAASVNAASYTVTNSSGGSTTQSIVDMSGGFVTNGQALFGYYSSNRDAQIGGATSVAEILVDFVLIGSGPIAATASATPIEGVFAASGTTTPLDAPGSPVAGKNIYVLFGNTAAFANATQAAVLKLTAAFASVEPTVATVSIRNTANPLTPPGTMLLGGHNVFSGDPTPTSAPPATPAPFYSLVAVPEPSAAILGALGALGLLRRRRI